MNVMVTSTNQVIEDNYPGKAKGGYKPGIKEEGDKRICR